MFFQKPLRTMTLASFLLFATAVSAQQSWEYLVKTYPLLGNDAALTQSLNQLGKQQWELVNCTEGDAELTCIFKRTVEGS